MAEGWSCSQSQRCKTSFSGVFCCDLAHCNTPANTETRSWLDISSNYLYIYTFPNHAEPSFTTAQRVNVDHTIPTMALLATTEGMQ